MRNRYSSIEGFTMLHPDRTQGVLQNRVRRIIIWLKLHAKPQFSRGHADVGSPDWRCSSARRFDQQRWMDFANAYLHENLPRLPRHDDALRHPRIGTPHP